MTGHLTSQQVTAYRSGVSEPDELLRLDDHLSGCAECRSLLAPANDGIRTLFIDFSSAHLTESQLDDYAARRPMSADLVQHLDLCAECRTDAEDLRQIPATPAPRVASGPRGSFAAAAAIVILALGAWIAMRIFTPTVPGAPAETAAKIPPQYQAEVQAAIDSGTLHIPASVTGLTGGPIQLRSESATAAPSTFHLLSPTATAVIDDSPVFRWTPVEGAAYSISIYDDHFRPIALATGLHDTEWHPSKLFPRGATYVWEVRAVHGGHTDRAPAATEPEARFTVMNVADADRLTTARTAMPDQPLALGILNANAGALADAKSEFELALSTKDKATAEKFLRLLK